MNRTRRIALATLSLAALASPAAQACNPDSYIGTVCTVAFTFCPRGTMEAAGQILAIQSHSALFALLGTTYGGNGQTTFALPDLRSRVAVGGGMGAGPGLSSIQQGQVSGSETTALVVANLPPHSHTAQLRGTTGAGTTDSPSGAVPAKLARSNIYSSASADTAMGTSAVTVGTTGSGTPFAIRDPYLGLRFCVVTEGIFPSRP